jgi:hypothetical protein
MDFFLGIKIGLLPMNIFQELGKLSIGECVLRCRDCLIFSQSDIQTLGSSVPVTLSEWLHED